MAHNYVFLRRASGWLSGLLLLISLTAYGQNPIYSFSRQPNGNAPLSIGQAVATDASGNIYMAGLFSGTTNVGGSDLVGMDDGSYTMYIAKYTTSGAHLWSKALGQMVPLAGFPLPAITLDNNNNLIVTGSFSGTTNMGGGTLTSAGSYDMFMAMYSGSNGSHIWSKVFGGTGNDSGVKLTVAGSNSIVVCGTFSGTVNFGTGNLVATGEPGSFVALFDNAGNTVWARSVAGAGQTYLSSVAYGQSTIVVSGFFSGSSVSAGAVTVTSANGANDNYDLLLGAYDLTGNLLWMKAIGGPDRELGNDIACDADGSIVVCGFSTGVTDLGGGDLSAQGSNNVFIAKYTTQGTYQWGKVYAAGSDVNIFDQHIAVNSRKEIAFSRTFAVNVSTQALYLNGYRPDGTPQWALNTGNSSGAVSAAQLVLKNDYLVTTGYFRGAVSFGGSTTLTASGNQLSGFLTKYNLCTTGITSQPAASSMACNGNAVTTAVSVTGTGGPFTYQWYKDGVSMGAAQSTSALSLSNVQVADGGSYAVVVTGSCVSLTSTAFALRVVTAAPTRLYVKANATGANTGLSWDDAFTDLQLALRYPCRDNLTEIWIAGGVYKPTSVTSDVSATFMMLPGVAVYGGFEGWESTLSERPAIKYTHPSTTTLSGDIDGDGTGQDNTNHIVTIKELSRTAILDGVTITSPGSTCACSGINNNASGTGKQCSPVIRNCFFTGLNTPWPGCYILNNAANGGDVSPEVSNCWFTNAGVYSFGLIANYAYSGGKVRPVLANIVFAGNQTEWLEPVGLGGLITSYALSGQVDMECINCTFSHDKKGVINNYNVNNSGTIAIKLTNAVIWNNSVTPFVNYSASPGATIQVNNSLIDGAAAEYSGTDNLTITGSPFTSSTDLNLVSGSPGINAGSPASMTVADGPYSVSALPATDLAGNPRLTGGRIDMGAFEYQQTATLITAQPAAGSAVCTGSQIRAAVSATSVSGGALSFQWYRSGTVVAGQSTSALSLPNVQAADAGSYSVRVSDGVNSETSAAFSLTVNTPPTASLTNNGPLSCTQTSVTLTAGGGTSYTFTGGSGVIGLPGSSNTAVVSSTGTYTVTVANAAGCRSTTTTTISSAITPPALSINAGSQTITCASPVVSLSAAGSGSLLWSTGETSPVISVTAAGTYSVTLTYSASCTAVASAVVSGTLLGAASVTADGPIGCGATTTAVRVQASGATSFTLLGPNGYSQTNSTGVFSVSAGGSYTGVAGQAGCVASNSVLVSEGGVQPTISSVQSSGMLGTGSCSVSVQATGYGDRYLLTGPGGYVFTMAYRTAANQTVNFPMIVIPGTYTLTVYSGNCVVSRTVTVSGTACP